MKEEDLLLKYCNHNPNFLNRIANFPEKERVIERLITEKNRTQFLSTISELNFGEVFHQLGFEINYEKKYPNKQTPDWSINKNKEHAICDVYRLNKSNRDQIRSNFENKLMEELQLLNFNYIIKITFINEYFNPNIYSINLIVLELKKWFSQSEKSIGETFLVYDIFTFKIIEINVNSHYISCMGNTNSIDYKPQKVIQYKELKNPNEISKKLIKYNSLIRKNNLPYFIAIDIDFTSGFDFRDFIEYFRGSGNVFFDYGKKITSVSDIDQLGKEWTKLGEFYNQPQLSGLILRFNNEVGLLLNPIKSQCIYRNKQILKKLDSLNKL